MSSLPLQFAGELDVSLAPPRERPSRQVSIHTLEPERTTSPSVLLTTTCHLDSVARLGMAIAQAGGTVSAVYPRPHLLDAISAPVHRMPYRASQPLRSLESAIARSRAELIIPCDERAVRHLHRLHAETRNPSTRVVIERSLGSPASYGVVTTRHDMLMLARAAGVLVPDSVPIAKIEDLQALTATLPFPWVIKADGTWAGLGVQVVTSLSEAQNAFRRMSHPTRMSLVLREALLERDFFWMQPWLARSRPAISVQRFVNGRPANAAVACWRGEVLAATAVEVVNSVGATGPSTIVKVVDNWQMLDSARRIVGALGMSGLVGFDYMIETATGRPFVIEMNPRNTPICHVRLGAGHDLVEALLAKLSARAPRERAPVTQGDLIAFFPYAWRHDPDNVALRVGYHDVPWEEPKLVRELMKPELRERYWIMRMLRQVWLASRRLRTT